MARGIYFSGDLEGLNRGMDSEERNRIAGRTGNQAFLANLAGTTIGNATARRGQDSQERMFGVENESRERIAGRNADLASQGNRFNFDAAMARNATDRERIGVAIEEIRQRESGGLRVDERAKKALEAAALDNNAQRATMEKIAQIQADAATGRLDPRSQQAAFEINASIDDSNTLAQQAAALANQNAKTRGWANPRRYLSGIFDESPWDSDLVSAYNDLPLDQRALVQIVDKKNAKGDVIGKEIVPIMRPRMPTPGQAPRPGAPTPTPAPDIFNPTNSVGPLNLTNAPAGTNAMSGLLPPPATQFTNAPATNRVIQAPRMVTPLSDIERARRMPTNQVMAAVTDMDPYAGWVPLSYEDVPMATNRPVFATPPIAAPRGDRGFTVMGETPLEVAIRATYGTNPSTQRLIDKLQRQPAQ